MTNDIIVMIIMLAFSAFFSGIEMAFVSANKLKIELKSKQGSTRGQILSNFVKNTPRVITTILVGNNIALVMYGISIGHILVWIFAQTTPLTPENDPMVLLILQTLVSTLVILIFGEYLPKAIFRINPDGSLFFFSRILQFFYLLLSPFVIMVNFMSAIFLKNVLRLKYEEEEITFGKQDLYMFMQETLMDSENSAAPEIDAEMFSNAMEFNETRVREFMIPRTEIQSIAVESSIEDLVDMLIDTELSRLIVYRESLDQVVGYVHSSWLFKMPKTIQEAVQPIMMVPESMPANVLFTEFKKNRASIAIVVDEFGGTEGLVTMEDLVEEVFGEIEDEHDEPEEAELPLRKIDETTWVMSSRWEVDDINKECNIELPEGDYNTIGGLIMYFAEDIPNANDVVEIENYQFIILEASENKVDTVRLEIRG